MIDRVSVRTYCFMVWVLPIVAILQLCIPATGRDGKLYAQTPDTTYLEPPYRFGVFALGSGAFTWSATTNFRALPGVPNCCPSFRDGFGFGSSFGILYDIPLSTNVGLHVRAGITRERVLFERDQTTTLALVGNPGEGYVRGEGLLRYNLDVDFYSLQFEAFGAYRASGNTDILLGPRFNIIQQNRFSQRETLLQPNRGTFENGKRYRNDTTGSLLSVSQLQVSLAGGIRYHLPLNRDNSLTLSPELWFGFNLNAPINGILFNINTLRAGLSLSFGPKRPVITAPRAVRTERIPARKTTPVLSVRTVGLTADGNELSELAVERRKVQRREVRALLPYIFFAHNSANLPVRYRRLTPKETLIFESTKLLSAEDEALFHYHHILNIVGERLRKRREATLTVVGCNNGQDEERNNSALSRERALAVKKYLVDTWGIEPLRIITKGENLPARPTKETTPDGIAENRRVELSSSDPSILAPLTADLPVGENIFAGLRAKMWLTDTSSVVGWYTRVLVDDAVVRKESGSGAPPMTMQWDFSDIAPSLDNGDLIFVESEALLNNGETIRSRSTALETRLMEKKYEQYRKQGNASVFKFALLLFEFDTLTTRQHLDIIAKEIQQRISPLSEITIIGHTDRTGTQEYNYRLAEERAEAAVRLLNLQGRATVVAAGQTTPLFTNELPEGRFYNRTAEIIIKTPEGQR